MARSNTSSVEMDDGVKLAFLARTQQKAFRGTTDPSEKQAAGERKTTTAAAKAKAKTEQAEADKPKAEKPTKTKTAKAAPAEIAAPELAVESVPFADRATKVPASSYKVVYSGAVRETTLGNGDNTVTVGGPEVLPFHLFEGNMPKKPLIAMEIQDVKPDNWPDTLTKYYEGVMDNPVAWAQKCVDEYNERP